VNKFYVVALVPALCAVLVSLLIVRRLDVRNRMGLPVRVWADTALMLVAMFAPFFVCVGSLVVFA